MVKFKETERIIRSYKFRMFPEEGTETTLNKWIDQLHLIWNHYLCKCKALRNNGCFVMSWVDMSKDFTDYKNTYPEDYDLPRDMATNMFKDLQQSYALAFDKKKAFFAKKAKGIETTPEEAKFGFPRYRNDVLRSRHFKVANATEKHVYGVPGYVKINKVPPIRYDLTRLIPKDEVQGTYAVVVTYKGGKWYVIFQVPVICASAKAPNKKITIRTSRPHRLNIEDDKTETDYLRYRKVVIRKYKNWQRKLTCRVGYETKAEEEARSEHNKNCKAGEKIKAPVKSKNYRKAHAEMSRLGAVLGRIHKDYLHKLTTRLVNNYRHIHINISDWDDLVFKHVLEGKGDIHKQNCGDLVKLLAEKMERYPESTLTVTYPPRKEKDKTTAKMIKKRAVKLFACKKWKSIKENNQKIA